MEESSDIRLGIDKYKYHETFISFTTNGPTPKIQKHMDALLCQHGVLNSLSYLPGIAQVLINEWFRNEIIYG